MPPATRPRCASSARMPSRHPSSSGGVAEPRAARQAAASKDRASGKPRAIGCGGRLTRASAPAVRQPSRPVGRDTRRRTSLQQIVRARQVLITRCAAAGSHRRCRHVRVDGLERLSGRNASPSGITPSNILSPTPEPTRGTWTEVRLGARAQTSRSTQRAHGRPRGNHRPALNRNNPKWYLTPKRRTSKATGNRDMMAGAPPAVLDNRPDTGPRGPARKGADAVR